MIRETTKFIEQHRVRTGDLASDKSYGLNGAFQFRFGNADLSCLVSDGQGWDHVSVKAFSADGQSVRVPTWEEMEYVKRLFFRGDEWAMELHAPPSKHVNVHPCVLHLWRPHNEAIPVPPRLMV